MADDDERDAKNPIVEEPKSHSKGAWTLEEARWNNGRLGRRSIMLCRARGRKVQVYRGRSLSYM